MKLTTATNNAVEKPNSNTNPKGEKMNYSETYAVAKYEISNALDNLARYYNALGLNQYDFATHSFSDAYETNAAADRILYGRERSFDELEKFYWRAVAIWSNAPATTSRDLLNKIKAEIDKLEIVLGRLWDSLDD